MNELYPDGYVIESKTLESGQVIDEHNFYHVLCVKIIPQPRQRENIISASVQKFDGKSWAQIERMMDREFFNLAAATGFNEIAVIHDPKKWAKAKAEAAIEAEKKAEADAAAAKKAEDEARAKAEAKIKADAEAEVKREAAEKAKVEAKAKKDAAVERAANARKVAAEKKAAAKKEEVKA